MPNLLRFYPMQWQLSDRRSQQIEKNDEQNVASYINTWAELRQPNPIFTKFNPIIIIN
jgi:hypothetical protein